MSNPKRAGGPGDMTTNVMRLGGGSAKQNVGASHQSGASTAVTMADHAGLLAFAYRVMDEVRDLVRPAWTRAADSEERKPDGSFVTSLDLAVEMLVRTRVAHTYPNHGVIGEELGGSTAQGDLCWVVDPIDGTHSLRCGVPLFGSLLGLIDPSGAPVLGVLDLPALDRRLAGAVGIGAFRGGERFTVPGLASGERLDDQIVSTGERGPFVRSGRGAQFDALYAAHPRSRTYCDCFGHALALEGRVGAMFDADLKIWDMVASKAIALAAGATWVELPRRVADDEGGEATARRYDVLFGKREVVAYVLDLIGESGVALG